MLPLKKEDRDSICQFLSGLVVPASAGQNVMAIVNLLASLKEQEVTTTETKPAK